MPKTITGTVRILFASFALTLLAYAGLDAALTSAANASPVGLTSCGDAANPCALPPLTVTATAVRLVQMSVAPSAERIPLAES
jgi:hypothetical protein